ncbi:patatin-like phospholipase family protein [Dokdonella sp.]|uniref:patatin-like phospholipase family protein n=1 Tax=Dokdonella sp. TaxID=2291710 RepID=UPI0031C8C91C|nr:patatin-like phospholipase family protein [Dokdonella sp.]
MQATLIRAAGATFFLAVALATSTPARGAETPRSAPSAECVGLVLGGGGARGAAHIGVLEVLEREHIPICRIAGTSMGAIVGSMYAAGYAPAEMENILGSLDWAEIFDDDPPRREQPMRRKNADFNFLLNFEIGYRRGKVIMPSGFVQGQKLLLLLRRLLLSTWDTQDFDDLPIPFRAVATDLGNGQPVVFDEGDLAMSVRSSMSVPGAFAPVRYQGHLLIDGGIVDNVPIDVARKMGATRLIVVDVGTPLAKEDTLNNPLAVLNQMVGVATLGATERQIASLEPGDVLITPNLGDMTSADFNRAQEAARVGRQAAEAALPKLRQFSAAPTHWLAWQQRHRQRTFDPRLVEFIEVVDAGTSSAPRIEGQLAENLDKPFDVTRIDQDIGAVYGQGNYQQISWRPAEQGGRLGLLISPVDKPWGPVYGKFGFRLNDDFNGNSSYTIAAELAITDINRWGARWTNRAWLGRITGLYSDFRQPLGMPGDWYLMPLLNLRTEQFPIYSDGRELAEYRVHRRDLGVDLGWSPQPWWQLSTRLARGRGAADLSVGSPASFPDQTSDWASLTLSGLWDTLNDAEFPTQGSRVSLDYQSYQDMLGGSVDGDVARLTGDWAINWGLGLRKRYTLLLGLRANSALDNTNVIETQQFLGGFLNLSGHPDFALYGTQSLLGRAVFYRRMDRMDRIFNLPLYVGGSLEAGNVWSSRQQVSLGSLIHAGSIFGGIDTPIGPLFLGFGHASDGANAWYLSLGPLLQQRQ